MTEKIVCENCTIVGIKTALVAIITEGVCDKAFITCDNIRCDYFKVEQE